MNARYPFGRFSKHVAGMVVLAFVLLISCNFAHATVMAYEGFDYSQGVQPYNISLQGSNGGTGWKNAWRGGERDTRAMSMVAPLVYTFPTEQQINGGPNAMLLDHDPKQSDFDATTVKRSLAQPYNGDVVYASFLICNESPAIGNDMALMWLNSYNGPKFGMVGSKGPNKTLDFGATAGSTFGKTAFTGDMTLGETYLLVARISKSKPGVKSKYDTIEMWIDPTIDDQDTPDLTMFTKHPTVSTITSIGFANREKKNDTIYVDEAMLGTTWSDVTPGPGTPPEAPEPATLGLLLMGGLAILRRNRSGKQ